MKLFLTLLLCAAAFAQSEKPKDAPVKFYRLDFVVKEIDDNKVINSRNYATMISTNQRAAPGTIRTGSRVPFLVESGSGKYQYADVGVNIDCRYGEISEWQQPEGMLALTVSAEVSSIVADGGGNAPPVIRQVKWSSIVLIPVKKPTTIFNSDDITSRRKTQLEVTATPIG